MTEFFRSFIDMEKKLTNYLKHESFQKP